MPERPGKLRNHGKESDAVFQDLDEGADSDVAVPKNAMAMELDINRRLKYLVEIAAFACAASQEDTAERTAKQRTSVAMPDEGVPEPKPGEEKQGADWTTDETAGQTAKDADGMTQNTHNPPVNNTESKEDQTDDGAEPKDSPDPAPSPLHRNKFANTYNGNFSPFLGRNPPSRAAWFKAFSKSAYKWHKVIPDTELQVAIKMIRRAKDAFRNRYTGWRATLQHEPPVSVTVLKIEAYDLPAMDLGGTSDPYCRLKIDSDMFQTDVQTQTLNPVWATDLTFTVKSYTNLLTVSVWDWDDGRPDDLIGQAYISSADLVRHAAHELVFPIADVEGKSMGKVKLKLECTSLADHSNGALDHPMCDATEVAALTRVLWVLGVPRAMTLQAAKVATLVDVPHDVLQRFGVLKSYQMVNTCLDYWLIEVLKRWKFYADAQADRREAERSAEALVKEFQKEMDANNWDNRVKALQQKAAAQKALIDIDQHIGYIDSMATSSEDNIRLAEDFVKRSVLLVTNVEKATRLADHFRSLRPLEGVPMPGAAKETRELIAEILAKFEKEALIIDSVHAAIKDLQERVLAEQGEEGTGLRGNPSVRSGWTKKWLKHKKKMLGNDQKAKVTTPLEVILIPFVSKFSVLKDLRQAAMDTAAQFALLQDQKGRLELGEVVLSLVDAELRMIREVEEAASRRDEELGDAAERIAREQREHEERQINSCMSWLLMHDERVDPDVKERIEGLVFYFRRNLTNTTSEAVKREREIIVMQVVKLKDKEQKRLEGTAPDEENDNLPKKPRRRRGAIVGVGGGRRSSVGGGRRGSIVGGLFGGEGITGPPPRRRRSSVGPMTGIFSLGGTGKKKKKSNNAKLEEDDPFGSSSSSEQLEEGVEEGEEQRRERQRMKQVKEISKRLAKEEVSKMKKMKAVREQAKAARDKELGQKDNLFGDGIELEEELSDSSVSSLGEPIRWVPKKQAPKIHYGYYEDEVADEEPEEEEPKPKKKSVKKKAKSIANALKFGGKKAKSVDGATPEAEPEEPPVAVQREEKVAAPEVKKEEPTQVPPALEPEKPKEPKKPAVKPEKPEKKKEEVPQPGLEKDDGGTFITGLQDVTVPAERVQEPEPNSSITVTEEEGDDGDDEAEEEDKEEGKQEEEHMEPKQPEVKPMFQAAIQRVRGKISKIAVGASVLNRLRFAIRKGVVFKDVDVDDEKEVTLTRAEVAVIESSNAFIRYKEQFQKRGRLKDFGMDDAVANRQQRAMMKHKMRQQRVMQSATSTLAFDYVCYSLAEDTLVAQKEFDVKARVVAAFKWSELCIVQSPEHGSDRITVCAGAVPNLHRLFATDMRTWLQWKQTRRRILKREMFVAYYFRIGFAEQDPAENANPDAILVRPYQRRDRSQEEGLGSGVGGRGIRAMPGRHVPIVFGADTGKARAMKQEEEEEEKDDEQDRLVQAQVERARTFLRGVLRMQACLRRLAIRKLKYFTPKGVICRELVMDMVTQAVKSSRGGDHLLHSLFGHQMDANGAFPVGSDAYTFVRSTIPMSQLTYSIGVDWDQLIATAEENELTAETARLMEEGRMRVSGAVQDSRRRTMLKCGWLAHQRGIEKGSALSNQILHSHHELPPDELRQLRIPQPPRERRTVNARRDPGPPDDPVSALVRQARPLEGRIRSAPEPPKHAPAHAAGAASIQASRGVKMRQSLHRTRARVARPPRWNEDVPTSVGLIRAPRRPRERASDSFANTVHSAAPVVWGASEDSAAAKYAMQWWDEGSESDSDYDDSDDGIGWYEQEISELGKLVVRPTNIKPQARHAAASRRDGQAAGAAGAAGADTEESAGTDGGGGGGGVGSGRSEEAGAGDGDGDGDGDGGGETGGEGEGGGGGGGHDVEVPAASQAVSDEDMDV